MATTLDLRVPRRPLWFILSMPVAMLGANFVWTSYNSILLLPLVQQVTSPGTAPATVGIIAFFSTLMGIVMNLVAGILSDRTTSAWGKRTPLLLTGSLLSLPFIALAAWFKLSLPVIMISYLGMQVFTNIANGAWWPLLVDVVPDQQRGLASGIQGFYALLAGVAGFLVVTWLSEIGHTDWALLAMGATMALTGIWNAWTIRGEDKPAPENPRLGFFQTFAAMFRVKTYVSVFFWMVGAATLMWIGLLSLQFYARDFMAVYLGAPNPDAALRIFGMVNIIFTLVSAVAAGVLSDKIGRRKLILAGTFGAAFATALMAFTRDSTLFMALAAFRSVAMGPLIAVLPALAGDIAPLDEAGQYMGYNNISTSFSGALAALLFGFLLNSGGTPTLQNYRIVFFAAAAFFIAGGILFQAKVTHEEIAKNLTSKATPND